MNQLKVKAHKSQHISVARLAFECGAYVEVETKRDGYYFIHSIKSKQDLTELKDSLIKKGVKIYA